MPGIGTDPTVVDLLDRQAVQMVPALPAFLPGNYEIGFFKHPQMLHDGAAVHLGEGFAERACRARLFLQKVENVAAAAMRQRLENGVVIRFA